MERAFIKRFFGSSTSRIAKCVPGFNILAASLRNGFMSRKFLSANPHVIPSIEESRIGIFKASPLISGAFVLNDPNIPRE